MKLLHYIQGFRKGKEAHRIEQEAMKDPFLADALEGYDKVEGDHQKRIDLLRKQVTAKSQKKRKYAVTWSIAASLLIGVSISGYFLMQEKNLPKDVYSAETDTIQKKTIVQTPIAQEVEKDKEVTPEKAKDLAHHARNEKKQPSAVGREDLITPPKIEVEKKLSNDQEAMMEDALAFKMIPEIPISEEVEMPNETIKLKKKEPEPIQNTLSGKVAGVAISSKTDRKRKSTGNIKGRITDQNGEPIIGANVMLKGTNIGTISDTNGDFQLNADNHKRLSVQYLGYEPIDLPVDTNNPMLIAMNESTQELAEAVVIGYGSSKKKSLTTPEPLSGKKAFNKYLEDNLIRPTDDACKGKKGKVTVTFTINDKGRPENITVKKSLCSSADQEAIRLIEKGPDWTQGENEVSISVKF